MEDILSHGQTFLDFFVYRYQTVEKALELERAKNDQLEDRVRRLVRENAHLSQQKNEYFEITSLVARKTGESDTRREENRAYDPEDVIRGFPGTEPNGLVPLSVYVELANCYRFIYSENTNLLNASSILESRLRVARHIVAKWERYIEKRDMLSKEPEMSSDKGLGKTAQNTDMGTKQDELPNSLAPNSPCGFAPPPYPSSPMKQGSSNHDSVSNLESVQVPGDHDTINSVLATTSCDMSDSLEPMKPKTKPSSDHAKPVLSPTTYARPPLQPLDYNSNNPETRVMTSGKQSKRKSDDYNHIAAIDESGEKFSSSKRHQSIGGQESSTPKSRSGDLLSGLSSKRPKPVLLGQSIFGRNEEHGISDRVFSRDLSIDYNRKTTSKPSPEAIRDRLHKKPLRTLELSQLGPEHFKLNPERNEGLDYAFDEVVREKSKRKNLFGCTRPECCGEKWRTLAKMKPISSLSWDTMDHEDVHALEEYMGIHKDEFDTLRSEERRDLVIEARTKDQSNRFCKHRFAHEPARSPPGFWDADMPTTQEAERQREEATLRERAKVAERYREAMRPGGRWIFADES